MFQPTRPPGEVVERREGARRLHRVIEPGAGGEDEPEPLRLVREHRDQVARVDAGEVDAARHRQRVQRALHRRVAVAAREEQEVEPGVVEQLRHLDPVLRVPVLDRPAAGVRPAERAAHLHRRHLEHPESHALRHRSSSLAPSRRKPLPTRRRVLRRSGRPWPSVPHRCPRPSRSAPSRARRPRGRRPAGRPCRRRPARRPAG